MSKRVVARPATRALCHTAASASAASVSWMIGRFEVYARSIYIYIYIYIICIHICIHKGFGSRHARLVPHRRLRQRRFSLLDQIDWYFIAEQPAPATTGAGVCE